MFTPIQGVCSPQSPGVCAEYSYRAATLALGHEPSDDELLAIVYRGEMSLFWSDDALRQLSIEALVRAYFDPQSGACCSYAHRIRFLSTIQVFLDATVQEHGSHRINLKRLLGRYQSGRYSYERFQSEIEWQVALHPEWRTGQGDGLPSQWGTVRVETGALTYSGSTTGLLGVLIVQVSDTCTLAAVIVDVNGRRAISGCEG